MQESNRVRKCALSLLSEYEAEGKYVNLSLNSHKADALDERERAALTALLYTTVEHKLTYDYYIGALSGRGLDKIDPTTKNILRLGLCQLFDMDGIPDFAAINETVSLARSRGERSFVNGILREAQRRRNSLPLPDRSKNPIRYLSVKYSFAPWIVKKYVGLYGEGGCESLLSYFSELPPTDLTVNTAKISRADYIKKLREAGFTAQESEYSPISVRLFGSVDPRRLPGFSEGELFVEDASSAAAVYALVSGGASLIVDVCSAPGGKSFAAAAISSDRVPIYAFDLHESKLSLIEDGARRLGLRSVCVRELDARVGDESLFGKADRVICDVPCSGLGVIRKKPDLRYKSEEDAAALSELQYEILTASIKYLKVGGILMYSTCTLLPEENDRVIERFLSENKGYSRVDFNVGEARSVDGCFTFVPHIYKTDGFFLSLIKKDKI